MFGEKFLAFLIVLSVPGGAADARNIDMSSLLYL